jgi:small conductance mechanosensitive channel
MFPLLQSDAPALSSIITPDSLQKKQLAETVEKIEKLGTLDYQHLLTQLAQEAGWILLKILLAFAIYCIGRLVMRWVLRIMDKAFEHHKVETSLSNFLRSFIKAVMMVMLLLAIIQTLGVNTSAFLALFASAGLAIGMALSGTLQNFAGGMVLLILRPYKVGDYIEAQGQAGTVESIGLFSTCIKTPDHQTIYVPNNSIATSIIDNYSQSETRRVDWTLSISYGDDVDVARREILALLKADKRVLTTTPPVVYVKNLGESSVDLSIRAWTANEEYWGLFFDMNEKMYKELPSKGINFPFPQMDVHVKKD